MRALLFVCLLLPLACTSRPLSDGERAFMEALQGEQFDAKRVRLVKGALVGKVTYQRKVRPRRACRERIFPPAKEELVTVGPAAVALFNRVHFAKDYYLEDYMKDYPRQMGLYQAMLFAHEMVHVWQWQNRSRTGYHPLKAASEHKPGEDPYLYELSSKPDFLDFPYEQQASIVEEYVCCRTLAPKAARTKRLYEMLQDTFPITDLPITRANTEIRLPWDGAELQGICS